uniref:Uncharacterized protein n=1 Tax=Fagus sylvatica TaxID=28930 RepID=A0A2N9GEK7_FAGSY
MVKTRASQIAVLEKNMERFQQQVDDHTGSIEGLHLKVDGLEAGVAEIRAMMQEVMKRLPVVEQPTVQPRQEEQSPNRVQANLGEQIPIAPREAHGVPLGAEMRNAMPMRPLNQDFRVRANQPRVGMQTGGKESNKGSKHSLSPMQPLQDMECTLVTRERNQWGWNDQDEAWFDPGGGRQARERPRQYQGAHHRDPYWQEQDGPPWNQGKSKGPEANEVGLSKRGGRRVCATIVMRDGVQITGATDRKLYLIEEVEDEEAELVEIEEEEVEAELEEAKAEITLCALLGSTSPSTMRVIATCEWPHDCYSFLILGSTDNFIDGTLAKTLKLPIDGESNFGVRVANGQVIRTLGECLSEVQDARLALEIDFQLARIGRIWHSIGKESVAVRVEGKTQLDTKVAKDFKGKATMKGTTLSDYALGTMSTKYYSSMRLASLKGLVQGFSKVVGPLGIPPSKQKVFKLHEELLFKGRGRSPRRLPTPCGQGVLDGGGNVKTPTIPHPWVTNKEVMGKVYPTEDCYARLLGSIEANLGGTQF